MHYKKTALSANGSIRGSAAQMWCLPFLIGNNVEENYKPWLKYLQLRQIVNILFAPVIPTCGQIPYLHTLINDFLENILIVFPAMKFIPKLHYLVHYPRLIQLFGPLIHVWWRFEGNHNYFKQMAAKIKNFRNIVFTMANKHQMLQFYELVNFEVNMATCTTGSANVTLNSLPYKLQQILVGKFGVAIESHFWLAKSVIHSCNLYRCGEVYLYGWNNELPVFVHVQKILNVNGSYYICGTLLPSVDFSKHFHYYIVGKCDLWVIFAPGEELDYHALDLYYYNENIIVLRHAVFQL